MLFNSLLFIFGFLPICLLVDTALAPLGRRWEVAFLAAASLFFYGWWNPACLGLLGLSILFNYLVGIAIHKSPAPGRRRNALLVLGIAANLVVLGYFKYFNFLLGSLAWAIGGTAPDKAILLPIGISFFTFTQIAFLVDTSRGQAKEYDPLDYTLFVTFFPHLLAGPLLHHKEMMPQFARLQTWRPRAQDLAVGLTIFIIGLCKKVVIADGMAEYANPVFAAVAAGHAPHFVTAWGGALSYAFQLYFDFSGYSDMAIGAARCFGIILPLNFDSPYQSTDIIEFWRRWHMTLSRFLRDYLYIPLGGNRHGAARRHLNLFVTMLLGGLWHGAAWTFVLWGALHGAFLVANHLWRTLCLRLGWRPGAAGTVGRIAGIALTFLVVVLAWIPFRATSFGAATAMFAGLFGWNGFAGPEGAGATIFGIAYGGELYQGIDQTYALAAVALVTFLAPNTQQIMARFRPGIVPPGTGTAPAVVPIRWRAQPVWSLAMAAALLVALSRMSGVSPFLYYQF
ncbi:MAG: rane bound O-acyl transferase family protein [Rhodospirillales bacterium]|nr:rane bound O-acyl transferase family protein [Rhodospirillales bacterium]